MNKKVCFGILLGLMMTVVSAVPAMANITMTFEEFVGADQTPVATFYSGITFQSGGSGSDWLGRDANANLYNVSSWPSGTQFLGGNYWILGEGFATTALDQTGNDGKIIFDNGDATFVELAYSASTQFTLEAYDAANNLLDSDSGAANLRYADGNAGGPGTLHVDWNGTDHIAYVIVHDTGNFWLVDDITTDASGITTAGVIPAPAAVWLGAAGLGLVGLIRRRFS